MSRADANIAWAAYEPSPACPWDLTRAAHLYRRAGFGATWDELQQALKLGPARTIERLLAGGEGLEEFERTFDGFERAVTSSDALRAWWLRRMIETPHPLREKMTLFWHDFFAVRSAEVGEAAMMLAHVRRLRAGAMGDFRALLGEAAGDPAVWLSLGAKANRKARPEEHFARQLLHRYTVGPDGCSQSDLRDASRALTGWFVLRGQLRYFQREHDEGDKTVLGRGGELGLDDVAKAALARPETARNIVRRLYRWLISEVDVPDDSLLAPLCEGFARDYDVGRLVAAMLRSNHFYSPAAIRRRVKRPVELAVGLVRSLEATVPTTRLAGDLAALGEDLYCPPTRDGWAGGRDWINPASLIGRHNLAAALLAASGPYDGRLDPAAVAGRHGRSEPQLAARLIVNLLLQPGGDDGTVDRLWQAAPQAGALPNRLRELARIAAAQPAFQLA